MADLNDCVYLLFHIREKTELLLVGAYRSEESAKAAIKRLKKKRGFVRYPKGFEYHAYKLDEDIWGKGFPDKSK